MKQIYSVNFWGEVVEANTTEEILKKSGEAFPDEFAYGILKRNGVHDGFEVHVDYGKAYMVQQ